MKATDLMIGDWVNVGQGCIMYSVYKDKPQKVVSVFPKGVGIGAAYVPIEYIEPIPLTPEILEKNRMRVFEHRNPWQEAKNLIKKWYSKDGKFYVSYYRVGGMFTYTVGNGVSRICGIKYVHELQHALKPCGIEKEIVL